MGIYDGVVDVVSGACGGLMLVAVGHPFDTLKVAQQTTGVGLMAALGKIRAERGLLGLYAGAASPAVGAPAMNSAIFFSWGVSERLVSSLAGRPARELRWSEYFAAGALTGLLASPVECAVDLVKVKMQVGAGERNTFATAAAIVRRYGVGGVFQGLPATMLRNVPANACYFGVYKSLLQRFAAASDEPPSSWAILSAGAMAGVAYWSLSYPLDFLKSRLQADHSDRAHRQYPSYAAAVRAAYAEGGLSVFLRGFGVTMLRAMPANAACFYGYEICKNLMQS